MSPSSCRWRTISDCESGNAQAFLDLRNAVAAEAATAGLTDDKLDEIVHADRG